MIISEQVVLEWMGYILFRCVGDGSQLWIAVRDEVELPIHLFLDTDRIKRHIKNSDVVQRHLPRDGVVVDIIVEMFRVREIKTYEMDE